MTKVTGLLNKMKATLDANNQVNYSLPLSDELMDLNAVIGKTLTLEYSGKIACKNCGRATKKSFSQGYCFPCMRSLARCDMCIMKPETCHYHEGTCREPEWGEQNCFVDHYVYLANTSGLKVGITRHTQLPTRWIDQGALEATPLFKVTNRYHSGLLEMIFKAHVADKTNWRTMLKGEKMDYDLAVEATRLKGLVKESLTATISEHELEGLTELDTEITSINYPVLEYPTKIKSFNFDKTPVVEGQLMGIKGQYLIFDTGVINIRKFSAYEVTASSC
jgi:hypothetical protein